MAALICALVLSMIVFPEASTSKALHRLLVEPFARWLNGLSPLNYMLIAAVIAAGVLAAALLGAEGLGLFGMMAPEALIWLSVFDASILVDLVVAGAVLAGMARVRTVRDLALMRLRQATSMVAAVRRGGRRRTRRLPPTAAEKPRRSDDPDPFGPTYAGYRAFSI